MNVEIEPASAIPHNRRLTAHMPPKTEIIPGIIQARATIVIIVLVDDISGVPLCPIEYIAYPAKDVAIGVPNAPRIVMPPIRKNTPQIILMMPAVVGFHVLNIRHPPSPLVIFLFNCIFLYSFLPFSKNYFLYK